MRAISLPHLIVTIQVILHYGTFSTNAAISVQSCSDKVPGLEKQSTLTIPAHLSTTRKNVTFKLIPFALHECAIGQMKGIYLETENSTISSTYEFTPEGTIIQVDDKSNLGGGNHSDFCIASTNGSGLTIAICLVDCARQPCIPKCCHSNELFDSLLNTCVVGNRRWIPILNGQNNEGNADFPTALHVVHKLKHCRTELEENPVTTDQHFIVDGDIKTQFRLLANGELEYKAHLAEVWEPYPVADFCMDGDSRSVENVLVDLDCSMPMTEEERETFGEIPPPNKNDEIYAPAMQKTDSRKILNLVHAVLMILSSIFLLFAMTIYIALWDQQNTHGWTVFSYIASLFHAYIFLAIYKFMASNRKSNDPDRSFSCFLNGILAHFFFESVFTWLTVINFDIWWKFWDLKTHPIKGKDLRRYFFYALFGFGVPIVIIMVGLTLGATGGASPGYGNQGKCFLQGHVALGSYLYYPIGALMLLNFGFFISTSFKIYAHFQNTSQVHEAKAEQEFESCKVIVKLFIVMGVTWVFEFLSFLFEKESSPEHWKIIWGILDCANILQALGIFYVFIWKRLILTQLWQKYPALRPFLRTLKGMPGCKKRIDYRSSSRLTTKSTKKETNSQKEYRKERNRKLSDSEQPTSFENIELS